MDTVAVEFYVVVAENFAARAESPACFTCAVLQFRGIAIK